MVDAGYLFIPLRHTRDTGPDDGGSHAHPANQDIREKSRERQKESGLRRWLSLHY